MLMKFSEYAENWLKEELALMSQEKCDELYVRLFERYWSELSDAWHRSTYYTDGDIAEDLKFQDRRSIYDWLAYALSDVVKTATYEEARELLLFALLEEVGAESAHYLCDATLLALINGLMGESKEAGQIIEMFSVVGKWYC